MLMKKQHENIDLEKTVRSITISDVSIYKRYLKDIFQELSDMDEKVSLINFQEYYGIHFLISKRLFSFFAKDTPNSLTIKYNDFQQGFLSVFANVRNYSFIEIIFQLLDCDKEGFISYQNVKAFLTAIAYDLNSFCSGALTQLVTATQIDYVLRDSFPDIKSKSKLSLHEFFELIKSGSSDLFFIVLFYLYLTQPFNSRIEELYRNSSKFDPCFQDNYQEFCGSFHEYRPVSFPKKYFDQFFSKKIIDYLSNIQLECKKSNESTKDLSKIENTYSIPISTLRTSFNEEEFEEKIDERSFILPKSVELKNKFHESSPIIQQYYAKRNQSIESTKIILSYINTNTNQQKMIQKVHLQEDNVENEAVSEMMYIRKKYQYSHQMKHRKKDNSMGNAIISPSGNHSTVTKSNDASVSRCCLSEYLDISKNNLETENFLLKTSPFYECYLYKKNEGTGKLTKFWVVLLGRLMFYFKNKKKQKLKGVRMIKDDSISAESFTMTSLQDQKIKISFHFHNKLRIYYCDQVSDVTNIQVHFFSVLRMKNYKDYYTLGKRIQKGSKTYIFTAFAHISKDIVVIKVFPKQLYNNSTYSENYSFLKQEIQVTKFCSHHPNIAKYIDDFQDENNYYLITEYIPGGDLNNLINERGTLKPYEIKKIIFDLSKGIEYLHDIGIIHRDIKAENVCLYSRGDLIVKLIDFGYATYISEKGQLQEPCGTIFFVAPEIMSSIPYDLKADVYSLGITMYFLAYGKLPFYNKNYLCQSAKRLLTEKIIFPDKIDKQLKDLIENCVSLDCEKRYTIKQILEHPYLS